MINNVIFENIDHTNLKQAHAYVGWHKDAGMTENAICQRPDSSLAEYTVEQFKKEFNYLEKEGEFFGFMMKIDDEYIGYGQIIINQGNAFTKNKKVAWPSIAIGESINRSKGFGKLICHKIYELAKQQNCEVIEVGVFEFNTRMKQILLENGFELIGKKEKLTFKQDRWWSAEHYSLVIQ